MGDSEYLVVFYGVKDFVLHRHIFAAASPVAAHDYVEVYFWQNEKYREMLEKVVSWIVSEVKVSSHGENFLKDNRESIIGSAGLKLTERETDVVVEMSDGKCLEEGAKNLCMSVKTLKNHITNINQKTDCKSLKQSIFIIRDYLNKKLKDGT